MIYSIVYVLACLRVVKKPRPWQRRLRRAPDLVQEAYGATMIRHIYAHMLEGYILGDFHCAEVKLLDTKHTIEIWFDLIKVDIGFSWVEHEEQDHPHLVLRDIVRDTLPSILKDCTKSWIAYLRQADVVQPHGGPRGEKLKSCVIALISCACAKYAADGTVHSWAACLRNLLPKLRSEALVVGRRMKDMATVMLRSDGRTRRLGHGNALRAMLEYQLLCYVSFPNHG